LAGPREPDEGTPRQLADVEPRGNGEVERRRVMVRERVDPLVAVSWLRLQPRGGVPVLLCAAAARDLSVGDVADQDVPERELGSVFPPDERPVLEGLERGQDTLERRVLEPRDRGGGERLPEDRGSMEDSLLARRQQVDARRDRGLDRLGDDNVVAGAQ